MIDYTKPIQMRSGRSCRVVSQESNGAWVVWEGGTSAYFFNASGYSEFAKTNLINIIEPKVYWARLADDYCAVYATQFPGQTHKIMLTNGSCWKIEEVKP